jgi:phosphopantothenoylcysteine decarboxylase/phosphopantothenate--cysteine ligase
LHPDRESGIQGGMTLERERSMLITAGPTHEPIDAVRYIGNRSSGRLGVAIAIEAARLGFRTTLLLGPGCQPPPTGAGSQPAVVRFRTAADLQGLLREHVPGADVLVMAAAVADFRPLPNPAMSGGKFRRTSERMTLELEATPDLLAEVGATRRAGQYLVGFALEPREEVEVSARRKLERKRVDLVVGNPLETMDAPTIEPTLVYADGRVLRLGVMGKEAFAAELVGVVTAELERRVG